MPFNYTTFLAADSFDPRTASPADVRFAFVLHLPFRLRVGAWYRASLVVRDHHFSLWLRNRISVTAGRPVGLQLPSGKSFSDLWTDALLVLEDPTIPEQSLTPLRELQPGAAIQGYPAPTGDIFFAMEALNHFVIGYATATNQLFGGTPLHVFRPNDFLGVLRWTVTLLGPRSNALDDHDAQTILDLTPQQEIRVSGSITGDMNDLPDDTLRQIQGAIALHRDFIFYEFAFEAKTKMVAGDHVGALLMAVAALEGVHAAYVNDALASRLPPGAEPSLPDEFLRSLGMTLCNRLTPYIFMDPAERPSPEVIAQVDRALSFRNEIMHSLRNRRGTYRTRTRTNRELSDAYSATLKLYDSYRAIFERLPSEPS